MRARSITLFLAVLAAPQLTRAAGWQYPHGDSANTGFIKQVTAPAERPMQLAQVGDIADGAGPVVGPDGTVYIGNLEGQVLAFHADGTLAWSRQLPAGQWVTASPVVGADGSVYVVAETRFLIDGTTSEYRYESTLHKFNSSGGWLYQAPFPQQWADQKYRSRGDASAQPNLWRSGGVEAIVVPAAYAIPGVFYALHLVAFSTTGAVLGDTVVKVPPGTTDGGSDILGYLADLFGSLEPGFQGQPPAPCSPDVCLPPEAWYQPGVAIADNPRGGTPTVVVSNGFQETVTFTFDPTRGFTESFHVHDPSRAFASPPVLLPDGHVVQGTVEPDPVRDVAGRLAFAGLGLPLQPDVNGLDSIIAAPTRLADGRLVVVGRHVGETAAVSPASGAIVRQGDARRPSIVSAAASCNFVYVASGDVLVFSQALFTTFDATTLNPVASVPLPSGGHSSPAIGPFGHVYVVAGTTMFVFPPLANPPTSFAGTTCAPSSTGASDGGGGGGTPPAATPPPPPPPPQCVHDLDCDDGLSCTTDRCVSGVCSHTKDPHCIEP